MWFQKLVQTGKDFLFPVFCLDCKKEGTWLCDFCKQKISLNGVFACPRCHMQTNFGICCDNCWENSFLFSQIAATEYNEKNLLGKMITKWKYDSAEEISSLLSGLVYIFIKKNRLLFSDLDYIVPVPLHERRLKERGFNQSMIIAKIISDCLHIPLIDCIERIKDTDKQAHLDRKARMQNMQKAFQIKHVVSGKCLLVDDVFTTGSTMQECAMVLRRGGAELVSGFSLARG